MTVIGGGGVHGNVSNSGIIDTNKSSNLLITY
jgi:hypothetical protein